MGGLGPTGHWRPTSSSSFPSLLTDEAGPPTGFSLLSSASLLPLAGGCHNGPRQGHAARAMTANGKLLRSGGRATRGWICAHAHEALEAESAARLLRARPDAGRKGVATTGMAARRRQERRGQGHGGGFDSASRLVLAAGARTCTRGSATLRCHAVCAASRAVARLRRREAYRSRMGATRVRAHSRGFLGYQVCGVAAARR